MSDEEQAQTTWRDYLRQSDQRLAGWIKELNSVASDTAREQAVTLLEPDSLPHKLDTKQKVVRLDKLIEQMHIMHAEVICHIMPNEIKAEVFTVRDNFARWAGTYTAIRFLGKEAIAKGILGFFSSIHSYFSAIQDNDDIELKIRDAGFEARYAIAHDERLKQENKKGKVRDVRSRHKTPKHKRRFKGCKSK